jgi:uncharacterized protein (DUF362 family)/Pyruvate/2-oxoacid:ferredoxin oxidoreductase delta subunit
MYNPTDPVALVPCPDYSAEIVRARLHEGLELLGGLGRFLRPGEKVLLKPNLLRAALPEAAVSTHPAIVEAVILAVKEAGAQPFVADSPGFGSLRRIGEASGLAAVCRRQGVPFYFFEQRMEIEGIEGGVFRRLEVARDAIEADKIINLAKAKTHQQMILTLGVKNLFGCVVGLDKSRWHLKAGTDEAYFGRMLAELAIAIDADLTILDAVLGMDGNGPGGGRPRNFGFLAMGVNPFTIDVVVANLFGVDPRRVPALATGIELGVTPAGADQIEVLGTDPLNLRVTDFLLPIAQRVGTNIPIPLFHFLRRLFTPKVRIRHRRCVRCKACLEVCPANAIFDDGKRLHVRRNICINCYCCAEVCPEDAVRISHSRTRSDRRRR